MHKTAALVVALAALTDALQAAQTHARTTRRHMLNNGGNFGQVFYMGYRYEPPNGLGAKLPDGVYEVALPKPCGIVFEESHTTSNICFKGWVWGAFCLFVLFMFGF